MWSHNNLPGNTLFLTVESVVAVRGGVNHQHPGVISHTRHSHPLVPQQIYVSGDLR